MITAAFCPGSNPESGYPGIQVGRGTMMDSAAQMARHGKTGKLL